jgi:hypothetical protein
MKFESCMGNEAWVPLVEFSVKTGISLSTLRRYIKANKVPWKLIDGRYLLMDDGTLKPHQKNTSSTSAKNVEGRLKKLEKELNSANEEITELKMLVAFYEEKWTQNTPKK